jgi:hypothetical protein
VLTIPLVHALVDTTRRAPSRMVAAGIVLYGFAALHAAGTAANAREVGRANRYAGPLKLH